MSSHVTLREAERRAFAGTLRDGLGDVFAGCLVLVFAFAPLLSDTSLGDFWSSMIFLPLWALLWLALRTIRQRVVEPRTGIVRLGSWRKIWLSRFVILMLVANAVALVIGLLIVQRGEPDWFATPFYFAATALVLFSIAAIFLNLRRLYLYGVLLSLAPLLGEWLYREHDVAHHGFPITFGAAAAVIILTGLFQLLRLVQTMPLPAQEATEEHQ